MRQITTINNGNNNHFQIKLQLKYVNINTTKLSIRWVASRVLWSWPITQITKNCPKANWGNRSLVLVNRLFELSTLCVCVCRVDWLVSWVALLACLLIQQPKARWTETYCLGKLNTNALTHAKKSPSKMCDWWPRVCVCVCDTRNSIKMMLLFPLRMGDRDNLKFTNGTGNEMLEGTMENYRQIGWRDSNRKTQNSHFKDHRPWEMSQE